MNLWQEMAAVAQAASSKGALHSIENTAEIITDDGIDFVVRLAPGLAAKPQPLKQAEPASKPKPGTAKQSPFLPPEKDLLVCQVNDAYNLVLNKFNVLETHALLTTTDFVEQTDLLTLADFIAVSWVLGEADGLVFYNGGKTAGASQPHRHFQLVPKNLGYGVLPIETAVQQWHAGRRKQLFPFVYRAYWLTDYRPETLLEAWRKLEFQCQPFNLLITRNWMLVVPRRAESAGSISVNSLGYAGALLVKTEPELNRLKQQGPLALLAEVSQPLS